jgi:hypothetical protein
MASAVNHITCSGGLAKEIEAALQFAVRAVEHGKACGLSVDQVAAIHLYIQPSMFNVGVNGAVGGCGTGGRAAIVHYLPYIKLLFGALDMLPEVSAVLYRAVRNIALEALLFGKGVGDELVWWMVISATGTADVLRDPNCLGTEEQAGARVVFVLTVDSAIRVKQFSDRGSGLDDYLQPFGATKQDEDEHLLRSGTTFVIDEIRKMPNNVTEVRMHEVGRASYGIVNEAASPPALEEPPVAARLVSDDVREGYDMNPRFAPPTMIGHTAAINMDAPYENDQYMDVTDVAETSFNSRPNGDFVEDNYPGEGNSSIDSAGAGAVSADSSGNGDYINGLKMPSRVILLAPAEAISPLAAAETGGGGTITRARKQKSVYLGLDEDEGTRL